MAGDPIEGQVLLLTAAKASVPGTRLPDLVDLAQAHLEPRLDDYRRDYERVTTFDLDSADAGAYGASRRVEAFLVEPDHWDVLGEELGFEDRETDAVRRAHVEQLRRLGRREGRSDELETALDIRSPVLIGEPLAE